MVSANNNHYSEYGTMGPDSGRETTNNHQQLLGANRDQICVKLHEMANKYIAKAQHMQDSEHEVLPDPDNPEFFTLQTWRVRYEDESFNPTPPLTIDNPALMVFVTKATVPLLTVEIFNRYREKKMQDARNRQVDNDLSVHIVNTNQGPDNSLSAYPTMITKINMPFMYARRAVVNTYYPKKDPQTGSVITVSSSIMNEPIL